MESFKGFVHKTSEELDKEKWDKLRGTKDEDRPDNYELAYGQQVGFGPGLYRPVWFDSCDKVARSAPTGEIPAKPNGCEWCGKVGVPFTKFLGKKTCPRCEKSRSWNRLCFLCGHYKVTGPGQFRCDFRKGVEGDHLVMTHGCVKYTVDYKRYYEAFGEGVPSKMLVAPDGTNLVVR